MRKFYTALFLIAFLICNFPSKGLIHLSTSVPDNSTGINHDIFSVPPPPHDTCLNKKFSVVFYLIQDSLNSLPGSIGNYMLGTIIANLNTAFAPICVSFENCRTVIVPNYSYNKWTCGPTDSAVVTNWYSDKTINIYIPLKKMSGAPSGDSLAYTPVFPLTGNARPRDYIVMTQEMPSYPGKDPQHVMGHFFGLPHTFAETSVSPVLPLGPSMETVGELLNCPVPPAITHGDGFCDTDADPYPRGAITSTLFPCNYAYTPGVTDASGAFYTPPTDNYMSVYPCRSRFTPQQYAYMARFILTRRLYLH